MCEFLIYKRGRVMMCGCLHQLCVNVIGGVGSYLSSVEPGCDECVHHFNPKRVMKSTNRFDCEVSQDSSVVEC